MQSNATCAQVVLIKNQCCLRTHLCCCLHNLLLGHFSCLNQHQFHILSVSPGMLFPQLQKMTTCWNGLTEKCWWSKAYTRHAHVIKTVRTPCLYFSVPRIWWTLTVCVEHSHTLKILDCFNYFINFISSFPVPKHPNAPTEFTVPETICDFILTRKRSR